MLPFPVFQDRSEAGRMLAVRLAERLSPTPMRRPVVLALPRGGVPVAVEIAQALDAPLDLVFVRKIGMPGEPELAAAAVVDGGRPELVLNDEVLASAGLDRRDVESRMAPELAEIERRRTLYLGDREHETLTGRTLIVVDDGLATGASMKAAVTALRRKSPVGIVVAVPVAPAETASALAALADDVVCLANPSPFIALSVHYGDFHQLTDAEVIDALAAVRTKDQPLSG